MSMSWMKCALIYAFIFFIGIFILIDTLAGEFKNYEAQKDAVIKLQYESDNLNESVEIDGYNYIGTLSISKFDLILPIMEEWSYAGLKIAPARYYGSATSNDLVICGHNYEWHFGSLKELEADDKIIFTDVNGNAYYYKVEEVIILKPTDVDEMISKSANNWDLTLFTCTSGGKARVTVRCTKAEKE